MYNNKFLTVLKNMTQLSDNQIVKNLYIYILNTWKLIDKRTGDKAPEINGNTDCRCAMVKVKSVPGLMVFPDVFTWPASVTTIPTTFNNGSSVWNDVNYGTDDFALLEAEGVVFLPAAGYRDNDKPDPILYVGSFACYQSKNTHGSDRVYLLGVFDTKGIMPTNDSKIYKGFCVRLVAEKKN